MFTMYYLVHAHTPLSHMCVCTLHLHTMNFVVHFSPLPFPYYLQICHVHAQRCTFHFHSLRSVFLLWTKIFKTPERSKMCGVYIVCGRPGRHQPNLAEISRVKSLLSIVFEMKDLGDFHYFLGVEVIHIPDGTLLTQRHYVLNMMDKFGMTNC